jgi:hypothetical protein
MPGVFPFSIRHGVDEHSLGGSQMANEVSEREFTLDW